MSQAVKSFVPKPLRGPEHHARVRGVTSEFLGVQVVTRKLRAPWQAFVQHPQTPMRGLTPTLTQGGESRIQQPSRGLRGAQARGAPSAPGGGTLLAVPMGEAASGSTGLWADPAPAHGVGHPELWGQSMQS